MLYQDLNFIPVPALDLEEAAVMFPNGWGCSVHRRDQHLHVVIVMCCQTPHYHNPVAQGEVLRCWSVQEVQDAMDQIEAFDLSPMLAQ